MHGRNALPASILVVLTAVVASGQPASERRVREPDLLVRDRLLIDDRIQQERRDQAPLNSVLDFQWGGWFEFYSFNYADGVQGSRNLQRPGISLWSRATLDGGTHEFFARMKLRFEYFSHGDEYDLQQDWIGPNFDQAFYRVDILRALKLAEPGAGTQLHATIGRQTVTFGTGYVLDLPLDAVLLDAKVADVRVQTLVGNAIGSYPNIDQSWPVDSHSARRFYGVQASYEKFANHTPFLYAIWNDDKIDERPKLPFQDFGYDSNYVGIGSRGSLVHNVNYWAEVAYEWGESFGDGDFIRRDEIDAWGFDLGLERLFDMHMHPRLMVEYMFASGDSGRILSPTNAAGGNRGDRRDTGFNAFGYRDTGLALGPRLSNLHIWKAGGSFKPLEKIELCRDLELGTDWFLYHTHHSRGAISDVTMNEFEGYVGAEMDYYINWRLASDVSWTIRWGSFWPGDAYSDQSYRHFLFTGVIWSF